MNKIPKERIVFDNYDLDKYFPDEDYEAQVEEAQSWWELEKETLEEFFADADAIGFFGECGMWHGVYKAGRIGDDFMKLFYEAIKDCDYWKIYDENGHMYLTCSHHDGSSHYEIKIVTEKGSDYYDRWNYNWDDKRNEQYVHGQIFKRYSRIPRFAQKQFGCPAREYEKPSRERYVDMLNNQARSFYSVT